jgi:hypothetical protein
MGAGFRWKGSPSTLGLVRETAKVGARTDSCGDRAPRRFAEAYSLFYRFTCKSQQNKEPTSGLKPRTCSLRVIFHALQGFAQTCKCRISKGISFLYLAACCNVWRSRWYQSGINITPVTGGV